MIRHQDTLYQAMIYQLFRVHGQGIGELCPMGRNHAYFRIFNAIITTSLPGKRLSSRPNTPRGPLALEIPLPHSRSAERSCKHKPHTSIPEASEFR